MIQERRHLSCPETNGMIIFFIDKVHVEKKDPFKIFIIIKDLSTFSELNDFGRDFIK